MTTTLRSAIALVLLFAACKSSPRPAASPGAVVAGKRDLSGFNVVEIGSAIEADVSAGPAFSVVVTGDEAAVATVRARVQGETLVVNREGSNSSGKVQVTVTLPVLHGVEASGASEVAVSGLSGDGIRLGASGASRLHVKATRGEHLALDASGASSVEIDGTVDDLVIDVSGASSVKARELAVRKAVIDVSGASSLQLNGQDVSGDASGASNVRVWGAQARLAVETSGASSVEKK